MNEGLPGTLAPELYDEWPAWRLVMEQVATLEEVQGSRATYSLIDVYKATSLLDMKSDIQEAQRARENKK